MEVVRKEKERNVDLFENTGPKFSLSQKLKKIMLSAESSRWSYFATKNKQFTTYDVYKVLPFYFVSSKNDIKVIRLLVTVSILLNKPYNSTPMLLFTTTKSNISATFLQR
jgi:hypothetical protein